MHTINICSPLKNFYSEGSSDCAAHWHKIWTIMIMSMSDWDYGQFCWTLKQTTISDYVFLVSKLNKIN